MLKHNQRFNSQNSLINAKSLEILANLKILCIGAGGLGVIVSTYLVSSGILNLTIIDGDIIEISNLNRQITYTESDCGKPKSTTLKKFVGALNSQAKVNAINEFLNEANANMIIPNYDLIIDCTDNHIARYLIADIASYHNKNLICGSVDGFNGAVMVFLPDTCYRCIFPNSQTSNSCTVGNIIPSTVAIVASLMVNETIKLLCHYSVKSKLISINTLNNKMSEHNILTDESCINEHISSIKENVAAQYLSIKNIEQFNNLKIIYLDKNFNHLSHQILNKFEAFFINDILEQNIILDLETKILVICHHGIRSQIAASNLISLGYISVHYSTLS